MWIHLFTRHNESAMSEYTTLNLMNDQSISAMWTSYDTLCIFHFFFLYNQRGQKNEVVTQR